jgi:hypothetical protein
VLFFQVPPAIGEKKVDGRHDYSCPKELSDDSAWTQQLYLVSAMPVFRKEFCLHGNFVGLGLHLNLEGDEVYRK